MLSLLLPRRKDPRQSILRGVYEENLKILGRLQRVPKRGGKRAFILTWAVLFGLSLIFMRQIGIGAPVFHAAGGIVPAPADKPSVSDYLALIKRADIPLKSIFGLKVKTIVIDPGHGGDDPGAIGKSGTMEKDVALDIARMLEQRLKGKYKIVMTRRGDETLSLMERVEIANSGNADLFISIHVNSLPSKPINIIETYYFGPPKDSDALGIAAKENEVSDYSYSEYSELMREIGNTVKLQESEALAATIQQSMFANMKALDAGVVDRGVKRAPFLVLLGASMPAVLAEVSCLSNRQEEAKLVSGHYREEIARYLEAGILSYLNGSDLNKKGEPSHAKK